MSRLATLAAMSAIASLGIATMPDGPYELNYRDDGLRRKSRTDDLEDPIPPMPNLSMGRPKSNWDGVVSETLTRQQRRFLARKQMPK